MRFHRLIGLACCCAISLSATAVADDEPDAAALVETARAREDWIQEVSSFYVRFEGEWQRSAEAIAVNRARLRKMHPELDELVPEQFTNLRPRVAETLEFAFDRERLAKRMHWVDSHFEVRYWDGTQAKMQSGDAPEAPDSYALDDEPGQIVGRDFFGDLSWLRIASRSFWWSPIDADAVNEDLWGPIEGFVIVGREEYHGIDCHILECRGGFRRCWIGVDTGFLHGFLIRAPAKDADQRGVTDAIAARRGQHFDDYRSFYEWKTEQPDEERWAMDREYWSALLPTSRPFVEYKLLDWEEIEPRRWFPMTQGYRGFADEPKPDGTYLEMMQRTLRAVEIQIDEPFPTDRFAVEMQPGVEVTDHRYDIPLSYPYDPDMSEERFNEMLAEARSRSAQQEKRDRASDELIGRTAPPFPSTTWLNSDVLTWEDLRGKAVILDFWAVWCGPCRRDFPIANEIHRERKDDGIVVIGIHTPASSLESVREVRDEYELAYPICIDVPTNDRQLGVPGVLFRAYRIHGIPHAYLVDREGCVAGHGHLRQMLNLALGLPREIDSESTSY